MLSIEHLDEFGEFGEVEDLSWSWKKMFTPPIPTGLLKVAGALVSKVAPSPGRKAPLKSVGNPWALVKFTGALPKKKVLLAPGQSSGFSSKRPVSKESDGAVVPMKAIVPAKTVWEKNTHFRIKRLEQALRALQAVLDDK